jgi:hypothetical protein
MMAARTVWKSTTADEAVKICLAFMEMSNMSMKRHADDGERAARRRWHTRLLSHAKDGVSRKGNPNAFGAKAAKHVMASSAVPTPLKCVETTIALPSKLSRMLSWPIDRARVNNEAAAQEKHEAKCSAPGGVKPPAREPGIAHAPLRESGLLRAASLSWSNTARATDDLDETDVAIDVAELRDAANDRTEPEDDAMCSDGVSLAHSKA